MASQTGKSPDPNYFTCTLGEAAVLNAQNPHSFTTINEFIDHQARRFPFLPAVAFPPGGSANCEGYQCPGTGSLFTFRDLHIGSIAVAHKLNVAFGHNNPEGPRKCAALLCPSSIDFLFVWLGLMRLGFSVLLIAPQCPPAAVAHLCKSCNATKLFYDISCRDLALASAWEPGAAFVPRGFPWQAPIPGSIVIGTEFIVRAAIWAAVSAAGEDEVFVTPGDRIFNAPDDATFETPKIAATDEAYIFHTSGTSTGLPKPIPQTNHAGIGVLPCLEGRNAATFTTTPLYHGGIADCFRAWTSNAMIWLFPAATKAITAENISWSLFTAKALTERWGAPPVKYFSSVPYIVQMLADDKDGVGWLYKMEIVGVGGAALPSVIGDMLVSRGVNLVSRFGSAECGFILSSHRNYQTDKDWQYLRVPTESKFLRFVEQHDTTGLSELVILKGWPWMAKTNRPDGSFATCDLFEPHPSIVGAWKYHSRSDGQITLITGKKFDPAPVEDTLASSSALVRDVLIFGNGRQFPGALIFPSDEGDKLTEDKLIEEVWKELQQMNNKGQDHTRISKEMIVLVAKEKGPLVKSSKGTVLRGVEEARFEQEIKKAYVQDGKDVREVISDSEISPFVKKAVWDVLGQPKYLHDSWDLYSHGLDSTKATHLRTLLQRAMGIPLPWNVVYDGGNVCGLAQLLLDLRQGKNTPRDELKYMLELGKKLFFSMCLTEKDNMLVPSTEPSSDGEAAHGKAVILTGATGALGAHILDLLTTCESISRIVCLVRAKSVQEARKRVDESLRKRRKPELTQQEDPRIICLPAELAEESLGLDTGELLEILTSSRALVVIHAAWDVNFSLPLERFVLDHIGGLTNLLRFASHSQKSVRFLFCSSTASVWRLGQRAVVSESISINPAESSHLGYAKSKWVAEAVCAYYGEIMSNASIAILRIGQLTGDTQNGIWNMTEAWPLMLSTVKQLGCLPDIYEHLSWLPVDTAAKAVVQIALRDETKKGTCLVYHLVNNATKPKWRDLLRWLKIARRLEFEIVSPGVWMDQLAALESHPAKALLELWRDAYGNEQGGGSGTTKRAVRFETEKTEVVAPVMKNVGPISVELVSKIWAWLEGELASQTT